MGQSPETYLGTERRSHLVVGSERLGAHEWSLGGDWKDSKQSIRSGKKSTLKYHFSARDVYLVLGGSGTVSVKVDGKIQYPSTDVHDGKITVNTDRMYHLVHAPSFLSDGLLELEFSPGIDAYAFTFGG